MVQVLLKFIGEQVSGIFFFVKGITCWNGNPIFDSMFSLVFTF